MLPVASLWASLDYKSVANLPIRVSQILYLILLISEINERTFLRVVFIWAKRFGHSILLVLSSVSDGEKILIRLTPAGSATVVATALSRERGEGSSPEAIL